MHLRQRGTTAKTRRERRPGGQGKQAAAREHEDPWLHLFYSSREHLRTATDACGMCYLSGCILRGGLHEPARVHHAARRRGGVATGGAGGKLPTIGFLGANTPSVQSRWTAAFVQGLRVAIGRTVTALDWAVDIIRQRRRSVNAAAVVPADEVRPTL